MDGIRFIKGALSALSKLLFSFEKPAEPKSAFQINCEKFNNALMAFTPAEKRVIDFFIAARQQEKPMKDYIQYISVLADFCDVCVRAPEKAMPRAIDPRRLQAFKTTTDILLSTARGLSHDYLEIIRREMKVPLNDDMHKSVTDAQRAAVEADERALLKAEIIKALQARNAEGPALKAE